MFVECLVVVVMYFKWDSQSFLVDKPDSGISQLHYIGWWFVVTCQFNSYQVKITEN